ncbi:MAG: hypothetical protein OXU86_02120 [Thaumarchaeota archaeon]|nr:hypothetical protein [Nitrososphaerota archaeon]
MASWQRVWRAGGNTHGGVGAEASGKKEGGRMSPTVKPPTMEEYRGLYGAYLARTANAKIEPFLRMLYDNKLIDCGTNPQKSELGTRIKIQKFVYFAQACFGLNFDYRHTLYIYGPHSPTLANDYFRIRDIKDVPSGEPGSWPREREFLDFAKEHNDVDWLEIASTLVYLHKVYRVPADGLIDYAERIKRKFPRPQTEGVCSEMRHAGFIG